MTETGKSPVTRIVAGSARLASAAMDWQATPDAGFYLKPLFRDEETGESSLLMKMDPGAHAPVHSHDRFEEIFVLEGDFHDAEHEYDAGDYVARAVGAEHEAGSRGGAVVLIIYRNQGR